MDEEKQTGGRPRSDGSREIVRETIAEFVKREQLEDGAAYKRKLVENGKAKGTTGARLKSLVGRNKRSRQRRRNPSGRRTIRGELAR